MKKHITLLVLLAVGLATPAGAETDTTAMEQEAEALAGQFVSQIKPALQQSMAKGGPALAIEVCAGVAPRVADAMSAESGWQVRRVSLNPRNASRAVPDDWERGVLEEFGAKATAGAAPAELVHAETVGSEVAKVSVASVGKWCEDNIFEEVAAHDVRNLVVNPGLISDLED